MKSELLKQIDGYPEYWVSTIGNVYSTKRGKMKKLKFSEGRGGYLRVYLYKNGKIKGFQVNRLVAKAFIPNPQNLPQVNHINEIKTDNRVCNLEWCTVEYNNNYGSRNYRISQTKINGKRSKPVFQYTLDGVFIKEWLSARDVQRKKNWDQSYICACCNNKLKTAYGYRWSYVKV